MYIQRRFLIQEIDFTKRDVGDDNTNPVPSFKNNRKKCCFLEID